MVKLFFGNSDEIVDGVAVVTAGVVIVSGVFVGGGG